MTGGMKKAPKVALDPLKIFVHASRFHESNIRLRRSVPADKPEHVPRVAHPAMMLSVFASELYLKCLLSMELGKVPNTHNLKALFRDLQPATRKRLEDLWDQDIRRPQRQTVLDHIRTSPGGQNLRLDLVYARDVGANSFIELRYLYETNETYFLLGDFPNLLQAVILERQPSWQAASHR
jgi:hypothetical protein